MLFIIFIHIHYNHYAFVYVIEYVLILPESMKYFSNKKGSIDAFPLATSFDWMLTNSSIMEMNEGNEANNWILYGFI